MSVQLTLEDVKAEFQQWRASNHCVRRVIPQRLWELVKQITGRYKFTEMKHVLGINHQQFKKYVRGAQTQHQNPTESIVKTSNRLEPLMTFSPVNMTAIMQQQSALAVELKQPDGQIVLLHANSEVAIAMVVERVITLCMAGK